MSSIPALLRDRVTSTPDAEAYRYPGESGWTSLTWSEVDRRVRPLALGLAALGANRDHRVSLLCSTRVEWIIADLAVLATGAATTTIYPSNTADECAYVINDSGTRLVIAENDEQVAKLLSVRKDLPDVAHVLVIDGSASDDGWVLRLDEVSGEGDYDALVEAIAPEDLATLIYTSGTTGRPKGVELTHANWLATGDSVAKLDLLGPADLHFLWLPLSHSFGKLLQVTMISCGVPTAVDGRLDKIVENLGVLKPTFMAAAPRIFEKVHNTVAATTAREGGAKAKIFDWAKKTGLRVSRARQRGQSVPLTTRVEHAIATKLVFSKLQARFGGRIRFFISGSAPLSIEMAEFFDAAGLPILEGYGLTESSAGSFMNRPESNAFGTVGPPLPGVEVKIAEDGEVLIGGPGIMRGYHNLPEATAEALTEDGWLRTGDIGELDDQGRLRITDRKKELIKTSGGKYVAPTHIEGKIKAACPYLSHVFVHGDRRNYCTALVTLDPDVVKPWAQAEGLPEEPEKLRDHERMRAEVQKAIDSVNAGLASYETIKKFAILPADFSVETGELTASLKVKRKVVETHYGDTLDDFYTDANPR
ncbi:AMP-dependent synthetase/ligase [Nonomuraea sp. NPDC050328]|uniref:AMP-dependent synthetase/ligase n=1 Tax=Nonomuraea sp. NPDC050328 TaxID=3364361 RepID=UPI0037997D2B